MNDVRIPDETGALPDIEHPISRPNPLTSLESSLPKRGKIHAPQNEARKLSQMEEVRTSTELPNATWEEQAQDPKKTTPLTREQSITEDEDDVDRPTTSTRSRQETTVMRAQDGFPESETEPAAKKPKMTPNSEPSTDGSDGESDYASVPKPGKRLPVRQPMKRTAKKW